MIKFKNISFFLLLCLIISFFWWLIFLFHTFPKKYYSQNFSTSREEVGIVVLTGGKGRIEKGLELLAEGKGKNLFISGVYLGSKIENKYDFLDESGELFKCCIFYGEEAKNTLENAYEVKSWLEQNQEIDKLILVSSYYHLPRSLIIFQKILPDLEIILKPAIEKYEFSREIIFHSKLVVLEFFKVFYTLIIFI